MRGAPAPGGWIGAEPCGHLGQGLGQGIPQHRGAIVAAPVFASVRQHEGHDIRPRPTMFGRDPGPFQHRAIEPGHPGVEDQRLGRVDCHRAVPVPQQVMQASFGLPDGRHGQQGGQDLLGEAARRVGLYAGETGDRVSRRRVQHRADPPSAPVAEPVAPEEDGEVGRCDALVGVHQTPAVRRNDVRQLSAGGPADPVMRAIARHRPGPIPGATDRDSPGHEQADGLAVRHHQVLHRRGDHRRRLTRFSHRACAIQRHQSRRGRIADLQIAHRDGQDRAWFLPQIAHHRPVAGFADRQDLGRLAADGDAFLPDDERPRPVRRFIHSRTGRGFDEHILHVRPGGGEGPGDMPVMAHDQGRHAECGGAGQDPVGKLDPGQVPDAGEAEHQMRVAGEQGGAGFRMAPIHRPFIRRRPRLGVILWEARQHRGQPRRRLCHIGR